MATKNRAFTLYDDCLGVGLLVAVGNDLVEISHFDARSDALEAAERRHAGADSDPEHPVLREAVRQLDAYFAGELQAFDLPLAPRGTEFQQRVWKALQGIPFGSTCSYGDVAREVGRAGGARAVGQANRNNPLGVVVPCHRVIAADGSLGGYAGGLDRKRRLLELEGVRLGLF